MDIFNSFIVSKYIAHRGYHNETCPENSFSAYQNAIDNNYAIELNVQPISDGTVVVFNDFTLSRMTGKDGYTKMLKKSDLKNCYLNETKETIPTLKEVLKFVNGKTPLLIDIKNEEKVGDFEKNVLSLLKDYKGEFAIQSYNPYVLMWFKENAPNILRGQISAFFKGEKLSFVKKFALKRLIFNKQTKPDFINYNAKDLPNRFVKKYKNLPLIAHVIKNEEEFMKVIKHCDNMVFEGFNINKTL